jgi:cell division protein FtsB
MPLDGLRAWIGEVERKLGKRTRVFLVLALIAIGGAGAAIYLAIDAQDNSVSESDVQTLQRELEARIGGGASGGGAELAQVEAEVEALKAEVEKLQGGGSAQNGGGSGSGGSGSGGGGSSSGGSRGGGANGSHGSGTGGGQSSGGSGASTGAVPNTNSDGSTAKLGELLEKTREEAEKAENK